MLNELIFRLFTSKQPTKWLILYCVDMSLGPDEREDQEKDGWITFAQKVKFRIYYCQVLQVCHIVTRLVVLIVECFRVQNHNVLYFATFDITFSSCFVLYVSIKMSTCC